MKKTFRGVLFALYILSSYTLAWGEFTLYHLTDTHCLANANDEVKQVLKNINAAADADVVVITGDVVEVGVTIYYRGFKRDIHDVLNCPKKLYVCGNHETAWSGVGGKFLFEEYAGPISWYCDIQGWRLVSLNNAQANSHGGYLSLNDMVELERVLLEAKEKGMDIIVCSHFPPMNPDGYTSLAYDEDRLFTLLKENNVKLFLSGHIHANNKWKFYDVPVMNLAATKDGWYTRYTIDGKGVDYQVYESGKLKDSGMLYDSKGKLKEFLKSVSGRAEASSLGLGKPKVIRGRAGVRKLFQATGSCQAGLAVAGNEIAFADSSGKGFRLDSRKGKILGEIDFRGEGSLQPIAYKGDFIYFSDYGDVKCKGWKISVRGGISSQPILREDCLVIGSAKGRILYIDARNGREIAEYDAGEFPLGGLVSDSDHLYFASFSGEIGCLDKKAAMVWRHDTGGIYNSVAPAVPAVGEKVVVFGGRESGTLYAYWKDDGTSAWEKELGLGNINVCDIHAYGDFILATGLRDPGNLRAVRAADGVIEWEAPLPFFASRSSVNGGYLVLAGGAEARIGVIDLETRSMIVDVDLGEDITNGVPIMAGDTLYQSTMAGQVFAVHCPGVEAGKSGSDESRRSGSKPATRTELLAHPLDDFEKGVNDKWSATCDSYGETSVDKPEAIKTKGADGKSTTALHVKGLIGKSADRKWVWILTQLSGLGDISKSKGISFLARSEEDNQTYIAIEGIMDGKDVSGTGAGPRCSFQLTKEWQEYTFEWADFKQPTWACPGENCLGEWIPDNVRMLNWAPLGEGINFDLWLDDVRLLYDKGSN